MEKADKILVLTEGKIAMFGDKAEVLPKLENNQYCQKLAREGEING